jgi:hypothetical protein
MQLRPMISDDDDDNFNIEEEKTLASEFYNKLNLDQKQGIDLILNTVENNLPNKAFFIDGPGKAFIFEFE